MAVQIHQITPVGFSRPPLVSGGMKVVKRRVCEMLPVSQTTYKYSGNNRLQFNISSANEFLDCSRSFIRFELRCYGISGTGPIADPLLALGTGGVHSLFKQVTLRLQNGTEICRIDDYHKWYAMMSCASESAEHVERCQWMSGDSVGAQKTFNSKKVKHLSSAAFADATLRHVSIADNANPAVVVARYPGLVPDNVPATLDVLATAALTISTVGGRSGGFNSARVEATGDNTDATLATAGVVLCCQLPLSIFQLHQFLPLGYIQGGLQLEIQLENPIYSLIVNPYAALATTSATDYSIVNPRFCAELVQPSEEIMAQFLNWYKAGSLQYPYQKVNHYMHTNAGAAGDFSFVVHPNMRSVISALTVIQNKNANTAGRTANAYDNAQVYDSIGTFLKAGINSYQYLIGSDQFPQNKVNLPDTYNAEAYAHLQRTFNQMGSILFSPRFDPSDWWSVNADSANTAESLKLILSYDFTRDSSIFSGLDVSLAPFTIAIGDTAGYTLNAVASNRYVHTFITGNAIMKISQEALSVVS
jgi:hypothetical protein